MRISKAVCYGSFLLLATLAPAQVSINTSSSGSLLGAVEGIIKFCAEASSGSEYRFEQFDRIFTNGPDKAQIPQVRRSDSYKDAFDHVMKQLNALPRDEASDACEGGSRNDSDDKN